MKAWKSFLTLVMYRFAAYLEQSWKFYVYTVYKYLWGVCVCVCVVIPFILDVRFVDVPAGVTQPGGRSHRISPPFSAVLALIFLARRIQPFLSLVDREVEFCGLTN